MFILEIERFRTNLACHDAEGIILFAILHKFIGGKCIYDMLERRDVHELAMPFFPDNQLAEGAPGNDVGAVNVGKIMAPRIERTRKICGVY